jgi:hypothetical protein
MPQPSDGALSMFVDLPQYWSPPEPPAPKRLRPDLTPGQTKILGWIIGFNVAMLFLGPIAGASLFEAVAAMLR